METAEVLIVSKTHMKNNCCVGGVLKNGTPVRLLNSNNENQPKDTQFEIGQYYTITYLERKNKKPPHMEDICVHSSVSIPSYLSISEIVQYLRERVNVNIWQGSPETLFNGTLQWVNGKGYVNKTTIPECSIGFWIPDQKLELKTKNYNGDVTFRYNYPNADDDWFSPVKSIKFIGCQEKIEIIPAGTLIRVSLARWWSSDDVEENKKCYLQLSGWYL